MNDVKHLSLFDTCEKLKKQGWIVVDEWEFHTRYLDVLQDAGHCSGIIIHCRDAVHPYFPEYDNAINHLVEISQSFPDLEIHYFSVNYYPILQNFSNINYCWLPEYHGYYWPLYQDTEISVPLVLSKKFLCLNKRVNFTRWILYKKFYTDHLLDDSYFSFLGEDRLFGNLKSESAVESAEAVFQEYGPLFPEVWRLKTPDHKFLRIDNDVLLDRYQSGNFNQDPTWLTNADFYQTSFCSVIAETCPESDLPNFSEKIIRALASGHIVIVIGAQNSVKYLKELGFDMFDDIIDHSYDLHPNLLNRVVGVFEQIDQLGKKSLNELTELKKSIYPRLIKNQQCCQNLYERLLKKSFEIEKIIHAKEKI